MTSIVLVILFVFQIIGFYFVTLLYMKVTKFNDLEKKQRQLMSEMDDSIAVYLAELKDENEKLIAKLDLREAKRSVAEIQPLNKKETVIPTVEEQNNSINIISPTVPLNVALKSYKSSNTVEIVEKPIEQVLEPENDERTVAFEMRKEGKSVEEIAKFLGKGKTEVELILKFR